FVGIRFERRTLELAVRRALGASSARLVKDAAYELALLSATAAVAGVLAAQLIVLALRPHVTAILPRADGISIDGATLWFGGAAIVATVLLAGVASLSSLLKDPGRQVRGGTLQVVKGGRRFALLPIAAVGMAVAALTAALALSASLTKLLDVDPGIRASIVVALSLGVLRRPDSEADPALYRVLEAVRAIPGVADAAAMMFGLPTDTAMTKAHGRATPGGESVFVGIQMVSESYHRLLGIPLRRGRDFAATDVAGGTRVAVINETLAASSGDAGARDGRANRRLRARAGIAARGADIPLAPKPAVRRRPRSVLDTIRGGRTCVGASRAPGGVVACSPRGACRPNAGAALRLVSSTWSVRSPVPAESLR